MEEPRTLIIVRGNSGSGKSSVARAVRDRYGRGCALIEQDYLRRIILREHDDNESTGIAPEFITSAARFALNHGYHVVLEGILSSRRYGAALHALAANHPGQTHAFYLDVSFAETTRRHETRPQASQFTTEQMRRWYVPNDLLDVEGESVIAQSSTLEETVELILARSRVLGSPANTYCPAHCRQCRNEAHAPRDHEVVVADKSDTS